MATFSKEKKMYQQLLSFYLQFNFSLFTNSWAFTSWGEKKEHCITYRDDLLINILWKTLEDLRSLMIKIYSAFYFFLQNK